MNLTKAKFKRALRSALDAKGFSNVEILAVYWLGKRCRERAGTAYFRTGMATVQLDGHTARIQGSIDTHGGHRFTTIRTSTQHHRSTP